MHSGEYLSCRSPCPSSWISGCHFQHERTPHPATVTHLLNQHKHSFTESTQRSLKHKWASSEKQVRRLHHTCSCVHVLFTLVCSTQTDRQTNRQAATQANVQPGSQTEHQTDKTSDGQADGQTNRKERQAHRLDRQVNRAERACLREGHSSQP